jgi:hypothetical protein
MAKKKCIQITFTMIFIHNFFYIVRGEIFFFSRIYFVKSGEHRLPNTYKQTIFMNEIKNYKQTTTCFLVHIEKHKIHRNVERGGFFYGRFDL